MKTRRRWGVALVGAGLVAASCSADLGVVAGVDGGSVEEAGVDAVVPADGAVVDVARGDAGGDAAKDAKDAKDALDADAGATYAGKHLWSKIFGGDDIYLGEVGDAEPRLAAGPQGSVFVVGMVYAGALDLGGGPLPSPGCYVARMAANGAHLWSKTLPGGCSSVTADATGVYVAGGFGGTADFGGGPLVTIGTSSAYVAKFGLDGSHIWSKRFGTSTATIEQVTSLGNDVVLIGTSLGDIDFGGGPLSGAGRTNFLVRLSGATGQHVWSHQSAGKFSPEGGLAADPSGNIIAAGTLGASSVDWGGGLITGQGDADVLVVKFDGSGNLLWTKQAGGPSRESAKGVATNAAGEIFITGSVSGTGSIDFGSGPISPVNPTTLPDVATFLAKLAPNGSGLWARIYSTTTPTANAVPSAVAVDGSGNVVITGSAACAMDFGGGPLPAAAVSLGWKNIFIAKLNGAGTHLWSKGWASSSGSSGRGRGLDVAVDADGNTLLSAALRASTIDMGGGPLVASAVASEHILAKFGP